MNERVYWSVEQCRWVETPPVQVVVPEQRADEPAAAPAGPAAPSAAGSAQEPADA